MSLTAMDAVRKEEGYSRQARTVTYESVQDKSILKIVLIATNIPARSSKNYSLRTRKQGSDWTR